MSRRQHLILEADEARRGQPADSDGDGTPDFVTKDIGGGALLISTDADGDGRPEYLEQRDALGNDTIVLDADSDGKPEQQVAFTVGPPPVRVTTQDTDLDGTMDRRETATYDPDAGTVHVVVEVDPENDGSFVTASVAAATRAVPIRQRRGRSRAVRRDRGGEGALRDQEGRGRHRLPDLALCHAGLMGNVACTACQGLQPLFCDGSKPSLLGPTFLCCDSCPPGFHNTDEPCPKSGAGALSCAQKPPECP